MPLGLVARLMRVAQQPLAFARRFALGGHVTADPHHSIRVAVAIGHHPAAFGNPHEMTIRPDEAELGFVRAAAPRLSDGALHGRLVVRVQA